MQNLNEGLPELHVEGGVNDGIDGAVDVAQPSEGVVHLGGDLASCAVGVQDVGDEKRQPAYDEDTWGGGQRITGQRGAIKTRHSCFRFLQTGGFIAPFIPTSSPSPG